MAEIMARLQFDTPSSFSARDEFDSHAGGANLTTKTAPVGGAWTGGGDTNDFMTISPGAPISPLVLRDVSSDTAPRVDWLPTSLTNVVVQADVSLGAVGLLGGGANNEGPDMVGVAVAVDASNYFSLSMKGRNTERALQVTSSIAGVRTVVASYPLEGKVAYNGWYRLRLKVDAAGRWWAYWVTIGSANYALSTAIPALVLSGQDALLATGGTLATRKPGLVDYMSQAPAGGAIRRYESFVAFVPSVDAACFASQSLEYRHDGAFRENAAGTQWAEKTVSGRNLLLPCSGAEGRTPRIFVKGTRNDPDTMADTGIDDLRVTLTITERYLSVPGA